MAFLNNRVTPEPVPPSAEEVGTELSDSLGSVKDKDLLINNSEGVSCEANDHGGTNECQEGLDGISENDVVKSSTNMLQNGKRSCSPHSKTRFVEPGGKYIVKAISRLRSDSFVGYVYYVGSRTDTHVVDDVWRSWTYAMFKHSKDVLSRNLF